MAQPSLLFFASPGELRVFDLADRPAASGTPLDEDSRLLDTVRSIKEVQVALQRFHRSEVETGRVFDDAHFKPKHRADQSLIRDLGFVRQRLLSSGLSSTFANAILGRAIFIRYLEDRGILTEQYYTEIARSNPAWQSVLQESYEKPSSRPSSENVFLPKVLRNKEFTYALFDRLAQDFNGDLFPSDKAEHVGVKDRHLKDLSGFLLGDLDHHSGLFFSIYQFDVIPVELISCIYEEFYKCDTEVTDHSGTHYTPCSLVEFVVDCALQDITMANPRARIIDPACGSGIFLVATFKRLVRVRWCRHGRRPSAQELRAIIRDQLVGIDLNDGAIVVAAFSLYLALLNYQRPKDIIEQMKRGQTLPHLIYDGSRKDSNHFNILFHGNAFDVAGLQRKK
ncbi:unnamed protein product, partial [marine sediment metagenome]